jgi:hypothetical protein
MTASPSETMTSRATAIATSTRANGTTRGTPESASQTKKSRLLSAICMARSRGSMTHSLRKFCTNNARCTRSHDIRCSSASASANHSTLHPFPEPESKTTRSMMMRVTSRGLKISRTRRTSSTPSSVETVESPPSACRS